MAQLNFTLDTEILKGLFTLEGRDRAMAKVMEAVLNQVLDAQLTEQIGADPYERTDERCAYRNGHRMRQMKTRVGTLELLIPRLRNGQFSTDLFHRYQRSEQALVLAMMEMVINGVSTRKVENITEELCGTSFSKSTVSKLCESLDPIVEDFRNRPLEKHYPFVIVDAIYVKVRENKRVRSKGLLIAIGVNHEGYREVIGFAAADSESETSWNNFFQSLKERRLTNVDIVVSDAHKGLMKAIKRQFQGAAWQRCQTHFSRNILDNCPKSIQPEIKERLRLLYDAANETIAREQLSTMFEDYNDKASKAMKILEEGFDDIISVLNLPLKYRKRLRTSNSIERLNQEIRRRERVIRIFPNEASLIRLIGALLMEHDEKWSSGRKYLEMDQYFQSLKEKPHHKNDKNADVA
ncbi:MAG: IS256 family transposase [Christensenellales bacterium]|jgi:putative transposase